jgi:hypothetical protein
MIAFQRQKNNDDKSCPKVIFLAEKKNASEEEMKKTDERIENLLKDAVNNSDNISFGEEIDSDKSKLLRLNSLGPKGNILVSKWYDETTGFKKKIVYFDSKGMIVAYSRYLNVDYKMAEKFTCDFNSVIQENVQITFRPKQDRIKQLDKFFESVIQNNYVVPKRDARKNLTKK